MAEYETNIGLEIHAELNTLSKIFCSCDNRYGVSPNTLTCPVCLGLPGSLPSLNAKAVELGIATGIVLGSNIPGTVVFERRNYFYPNLAKGYQITERSHPIGIGGGIKLASGKFVAINRIHLEEDSGKMVAGSDGLGYVDFNRSGVPLVEIVTEPVMSNTDEAIEFISLLRDKLVFAGISDCRIEEGGLRFDVNMSVRERRFGELGVRVEMKNLSSFKTLAKALDYETRRQLNEIQSGNLIKKETRVWNEELGRTYSLREKEDAKDYRYFPDPDLKPLFISEELVKQIKDSLPESKDVRHGKYRNWGLSDDTIDAILSDKALADYFEKLVDITHNPSVTADWIVSTVKHIAKAQRGVSIEAIIDIESISFVINQVVNDKISRASGKLLLEKVAQLGKPASTIIKELGLQGTVGDGDIEEIVKSEIDCNANLLDEYCCTPDAIINYLMGKVMSITNSKAMPDRAREIIVQLLDGM